VRRADDLQFVLLAAKRGWQDRCDAAAHGHPRRWGDGAVYLSWQRGEIGASAVVVAAIFWTALAGGILLKGPLILMFVGLTIAVLAISTAATAWFWRMRPVWGLMWLLVLVLRGRRDLLARRRCFFADSIGGDMLSSLAAQESRRAAGLYLLLFW